MLQPILVRVEGERYIVIAGHRRLEASRRLGLADIPCRIVDVTALQSDIFCLMENLQRADLNPVEEGKAFLRIAELYQMSAGDIAAKLSLSEGYVRGRIDCVYMAEDIKRSLSAKLINLSVARELSKLTDDEDRIYYLRMAIENGATLSTVQCWVLDVFRAKNLRPPAQTIDGAPENEKMVSAILEAHPHCDFCGLSLAAKRRVMMLICGECWQAWERQKVLDRASMAGMPDPSTLMA